MGWYTIRLRQGQIVAHRQLRKACEIRTDLLLYMIWLADVMGRTDVWDGDGRFCYSRRVRPVWDGVSPLLYNNKGWDD